MDKFGSVLGWITAVCYFVAVSNLFIKQIFRTRVAKLPKGNAFKSVYQIFMRIVVKYHRYFGMTAGACALFHLYWQIVNVRVSYSGVLVASLLAVTAVLGIFTAYGHMSRLVKVHRPAALVVLAVIIFHMITKL
jgi:hypothetical protein